MKSTHAKVLAISPIVGGAPVSGPAGKLMAAKGLPVSAVGVAQLYRAWLDILVLDQRDRTLVPHLVELGVTPVLTDTMMADRRDEAALARAVLKALGE